ncbi:trimeric LpxA-like protein [Bisporella sp. PMI_857]|nr:trimeric LpxA-like protein [Bisporella sp. PMI_857]
MLDDHWISGQGPLSTKRNGHQLESDRVTSISKETEKKEGKSKPLSELSDTSILPSDKFGTLGTGRMAVVKRILGKLGLDTNIEAPFFCTFGCQIFVGKGCYINRNVQVFDSALATLGQRVLVGLGAMICADTHELDAGGRRANGGSLARPVEIGDDVWIGANAMLPPGIKIGSGAVRLQREPWPQSLFQRTH